MTPDAQTRAAMAEAAAKVFALSYPGRDSRIDDDRLVRDIIAAAILVAEKAGWKLVGVEPTLPMMGDFEDAAQNGCEMPELWRAMHAAAPGWGDG